MRQGHLLQRLEGSHGLYLRQIVESIPEDFPESARTLHGDLEASETAFSLDETQCNPGRMKVPDFASLHPGYMASS